ncbi:MAG: hypothetical protein ACLQVD_09430, partial [Capsulimonadaceae bacterium]
MKLFRQVVLVLALTLIPLSAFATASISISPISLSKAVGETIQFTATVTGVTPTTVTWSAGGITGGNPAVGTITSTGLYTAPHTVPATNPVKIVATSTAAALSATANVTVLLEGPKLTSISPADVPPGAFTLTLYGARFASGAIVQESYGTTIVDMEPTTITTSQILVSGNQGAATTASFQVKNPGSAWSDTLTVTVSPSVVLNPLSPSVVVGGSTEQFDAVAYGLTPATITWSVGGVTGGNATVGTVSPTGLYTSPAAIPGQDPVQITATGTANTAYSASTYIDIIPKGPTLSSVAPASIAVGNFTVTLTGNGFLTGAQVLETSGTTSATLTNTSLTSTQIVATGYQGNAASASFKVKNPGSGWSKTITIPVTSGSNHTLTVVNGTGGGSYASGATVTITADAPPTGQ